MTSDDLSHLPLAHAVALRMQALNLPDDVIAQVLDLDPAAVAPLLEVARAKLTRLRDEPGRSLGAIAAEP